MKSLRKDYDPSVYSEYLKLGEELQQLSLNAIACKFEVNKSAISAIDKLDDEDVRLIRDLIAEKSRLISRRQELRNRLK